MERYLKILGKSWNVICSCSWPNLLVRYISSYHLNVLEILVHQRLYRYFISLLFHFFFLFFVKIPHQDNLTVSMVSLSSTTHICSMAILMRLLLLKSSHLMRCVTRSFNIMESHFIIINISLCYNFYAYFVHLPLRVMNQLNDDLVEINFDFPFQWIKTWSVWIFYEPKWHVCFAQQYQTSLVAYEVLPWSSFG